MSNPISIQFITFINEYFYNLFINDYFDIVILDFLRNDFLHSTEHIPYFILNSIRPQSEF